MNNDIILVDYFGTVVYRKIDDDLKKRIWASYVSSSFCFSISAEDLYSSRIGIENYLYYSSKTGEYCYEDLCKTLFRFLESRKILNSQDEQLFVHTACDIELKLELEYQVINKEIVQYLIKHKNSGCKIILVSDFYMGKKYFDCFLCKHKLEGLFEKVYVSCDLGLNKRTGSIYKFILSCFSEKERFLMIGDNIDSDVRIPTRLGIKAKQWKKKIPLLDPHKQLIKSKMEGMNGRFFSDYVYSLYVFCSELYLSCVIRGVKEIYFLSREGLFLKTLFDKFQEKYELNIQTHYLYASRSSLFLPSLKKLQNEDFHCFTREYKNYTLKTLLLTIGFSEEEINSFSIKQDVLNDTVDSNTWDSSLMKLKNNPKVALLYEQKRSSAKENALLYFDKEFKNEENIYLVDIGWKGSMQDCLYGIYEGKRSFSGFYLGLTGLGDCNTGNVKMGILADFCVKSSHFNSNIFAFDMGFYEILCVANHGKTVKYDEQGKPILEDDEDVYLYKKYGDEIQSKIKKRFDRILSIFPYPVLWKEDILIFEKKHRNVFYKYSLKELITMKDTYSLHKDGFPSGYHAPNVYMLIIKKILMPYFRLKRYEK